MTNLKTNINFSAGMKKILKGLIVPALMLCAMFCTPTLASAKVYTLTNGDEFEGTEQELKYAEFLLTVEPEVPKVVLDTWAQTVKGYKFTTLSDVRKTATFAGDAGYDSKTGEYYVGNTKGTGKIVFTIKHTLSRTKVDKIVTTFVKNLEKTLNKMEKDAGAKPVKKVKKGSDLDYMLKTFSSYFYDLGTQLGVALSSVYVDVDTTLNKTTPQPILLYSSYGKKNSPVTTDAERADYYRDMAPVNEEELYFEQDGIVYLPVYINFEVDNKAAAGTVMRIKLQDVRALPTLRADEIWPDLVE